MPGPTFLEEAPTKFEHPQIVFKGVEDRHKLLAADKKVFGLPIVTEMMNLCEIDLVTKYVDVIQVENQNI